MKWKKILIGEWKSFKHTSEDGNTKVEFLYRSGLLPNLAVVAVIVLLLWWLVFQRANMDYILSFLIALSVSLVMMKWHIHNVNAILDDFIVDSDNRLQKKLDELFDFIKQHTR